MAEPSPQGESQIHDPAMPPTDQRFWIILTLVGGASATIFGVGLFAPFEENWLWGIVYVVIGILGFIMTVFLLRPPQYRPRLRQIQKLFIPGWILVLLGALPLLQWLIGGASPPNIYTIAAPIVMGATLIVGAALPLTPVNGASFLKRLKNIAISRERGVWVCSVGGLFLCILFQMYSIRQDVNVYIMPRVVTEAQKVALTRTLGNVVANDKRIFILIPPYNPEALSYANQLMSAIEMAGWQPSSPHVPSDKEPQITESGSCGLRSDATGENDATTKLDGNIVRAFNEAGLDIRCGGGGVAGAHKFYLIVNARPIEINRSFPIIYYLGRWLITLTGLPR